MAGNNPFQNLVTSPYVSQFVPMPTQQLMQSGQMLNQAFLENRQRADLIDEYISGLSAATGQDKEALAALNQGIRERLDSIEAYESAGPQVRGLAKEVSRSPAYKAIASNAAAVQKFRDYLQKRTEEGNLSPQRAREALEMSLSLFGGSINPDGTTNTFTGYDPAGTYDFSQLMKDLNDTIGITEGGNYVVAGKDGTEHISQREWATRGPEIIKAVIEGRMALDPQLQNALYDDALFSVSRVDEDGNPLSREEFRARVNEAFENQKENLVVTAQNELQRASEKRSFKAFTPNATEYVKNQNKYNFSAQHSVNFGYQGNDKVNGLPDYLDVVSDLTERLGNESAVLSKLNPATADYAKQEALVDALQEEMLSYQSLIDNVKADLELDDNAYNFRLEELKRLEEEAWEEAKFKDSNDHSPNPRGRDAWYRSILQNKIMEKPQLKALSEGIANAAGDGSYTAYVGRFANKNANEAMQIPWVATIADPELGTQLLEDRKTGKQISREEDLRMYENSEAVYLGSFVDRDGRLKVLYQPFTVDDEGVRTNLPQVKSSSFNPKQLLAQMAKERNVDVGTVAAEMFANTKLNNPGSTWDVGKLIGAGARNLVVRRGKAGEPPYVVAGRVEGGLLETLSYKDEVTGKTQILGSNDPSQAVQAALSMGFNKLGIQ